MLAANTRSGTVQYIVGIKLNSCNSVQPEDIVYVHKIGFENSFTNYYYYIILMS